MKVYMVGGAVRDMVMGITPKDIDYVVVGATPADLLAQGYQQVGADFPVFLHPETGEEYALARQERKTGVGYNGFETFYDPTVTLEDDLYRRDLTINAMAMDLETGKLIDPYGGQIDIAARVLRHTSGAFVEDPVRVLRTARFAARYGFEVDPGTIELMKRVVPELDHVPAERVFAEFQKGMSEDEPYQMIRALWSCEAQRSQRVEPFMRDTPYDLRWINSATPMHVRMAMLLAGFKDDEYEACKIPTEFSRVSKSVNKHHLELLSIDHADPADAVRVFEALRTFSDPEHSERVFDVVKLYIKKTAFYEFRYTEWKGGVNRRVAAARSIDAAAIAAACADSKSIRQAIFNARVDAVGM